MRHAAELIIRSLPGVMGLHSAFFDPGDLDLSPLPLILKLVRARDQTRLHCKFIAICSAVPDIFEARTKNVTDGAKNRTLRSSLRVVKIGSGNIWQSYGQGSRMPQAPCALRHNRPIASR